MIDPLNHRPGFILGVDALDHTDLFTLDTRRPERFLFALLVVFNHLVGSVEDIGRRAIILLHFDDVSPGKVLFKIKDIAWICAAPAINRLVIVPNHAEVVPLAGEPLHQSKLRGVGILILINHDVLEAVLVACLNFGEFVKEPHHQHDQVIKINRIVTFQAFLVLGINLLRHLTNDITAHEWSKLLRWQQTVLGVGNLPENGVGLKTVISLDVVHQVPDQTLLIRGTINTEIALVAQMFDIFTQDATAERMKGRDLDPLRLGFPRQTGNTLPHFLGGLIGKSHRQNTLRINTLRPDQVSHPVRDHIGLAGAGTRQQKKRPLRM